MPVEFIRKPDGLGEPLWGSTHKSGIATGTQIVAVAGQVGITASGEPVSGAKDVSGYIGHFAVDLARETLERLPKNTCPVLVVPGDQDLITLTAYNRRVAAAIAGARLVEIPKPGHLAFLKQPEAMNAAIGKFLQEA